MFWYDLIFYAKSTFQPKETNLLSPCIGSQRDRKLLEEVSGEGQINCCKEVFYNHIKSLNKSPYNER